jgi:Fe-S cluster assembly protein SufD
MALEIAQRASYLESFTEFLKQTSGDTPRWLRDLRERAFARFCAVGFPTSHDEDWRFTNVSALVRTPFRLVRQCTAELTASDLVAWRMKEAIVRMVFLDGHFAPGLSTWGALPKGVSVDGLSRAIGNRKQVVTDHLGHYLDIDRDPFSALNTAFVEDGAYVHVSKGVVIEQPIHLLFVSTSNGDPAMTHPRNLIVIEDEGQASLVEDYVSYGAEVPALSNAVTELVAGGNSTVIHTMIEREHLHTYNFSTLRIEQARGASVTSHSLLLGGALVRNNVHPVLAGEGGECSINGLFIGDGQQHLDNYMLVEHASPHCSSRQFYNGILDGHSHGVFHGRIIVHKDAQKTDAKQTNRNLVLSDDAQIDTKPQLEIHADDVKCTHGATIGQIEENALFYLRTRGISEIEARRLLLQAFAGECLDRMNPGSVRSYAETLLGQRILTLANPATSENFEESRCKKEDGGRNWKELA